MSITEDPTEVERRPWPRHPRYLVGADGTIIGPRGRKLKPQLIGPAGRKYPAIGVHTLGTSRTASGRTKKWKVATIVCETFHGPRPEGYHAAHEDGDVLNSRADNLSWKTPRENAGDKVRHNTTPARGTDCNLSRLTESQVVEIRRRRAAGETTLALAAAFGTTSSTISKIANRQTWGHL